MILSPSVLTYAGLMIDQASWDLDCDRVQVGAPQNSAQLGGGNMLANSRRLLAQLHREDSGQDMIEYALIAALIALAAVFGMGSVAKAINDAFSSIGEKLKSYVG